MKTEAFSLASATDTCFFNTLIRVIRYDEGAGTGTPKIRIRSLQNGAVDIEMIPGRQVRLPEPVAGIVITNLSGAAITGKLTMGAGDVTDNSLVGTVTLDAATLAALESLDMNPATLATLRQPLDITGSFNASGIVAANTAVQIFSPASNGNGAILLSAQISDLDATARSAALLAKSSPPANEIDGVPLLRCSYFGSAGASVYITRGEIFTPQFIAAGLGLYFISGPGTTNLNSRVARYRLL